MKVLPVLVTDKNKDNETITDGYKDTDKINNGYN